MMVSQENPGDGNLGSVKELEDVGDVMSAKSVAEVPNLMKVVTKSGNNYLLSTAWSTSRVVSCPIASLLGWIFTIFVVFTCEGYTERLARLPLIKERDEITCKSGLIYVYNLSEVYNREFVRECASFKKGRDLCMYMDNGGMGRAFEFGRPAPWYNTWQFALELYFHERLLRHPCVTERADLADAFFVPYYAGMDLSRRFTHRLPKGELYTKLAAWLQAQESWKRRQGRDHFITLGRIAADFHRPGADPRSWGNEMLRQKVFNAMVVLSIERKSASEIAIPYPTYFHDASSAQLRNLVDWSSQASQRVSLVTMAAGQRQASTNRVRHRLMAQCNDDPRCTLLLCVGNEASPEEMRNVSVPVKMEGTTLNVPCNNPPVLLSAMHQSEFCLQPPGDSPTRRSFFDAMLVGCIPVIFRKEAAWSQYVHHLPENGASYSVMIPMSLANKRNVIDILSQVSQSRIREMRANIAKLIPRILYASINEGRSGEIPDAFDIALDAVLKRINSSLKVNSS